MYLPPILSMLANTGCCVFDPMLRLIGIAAIVFAFFKGIKLLITPASAPPTPVPSPAADRSTLRSPVVSGDGIAPEIIAVIAAAVATITGSSRRIVSIRSQGRHWEMAGRQSVLTSHRIR